MQARNHNSTTIMLAEISGLKNSQWTAIIKNNLQYKKQFFKIVPSNRFLSQLVGLAVKNRKQDTLMEKNKTYKTFYKVY